MATLFVALPWTVDSRMFLDVIVSQFGSAASLRAQYDRGTSHQKHC